MSAAWGPPHFLHLILFIPAEFCQAFPIPAAFHIMTFRILESLTERPMLGGGVVCVWCGGATRQDRSGPISNSGELTANELLPGATWTFHVIAIDTHPYPSPHPRLPPPLLHGTFLWRSHTCPSFMFELTHSCEHSVFLGFDTRC